MGRAWVTYSSQTYDQERKDEIQQANRTTMANGASSPGRKNIFLFFIILISLLVWGGVQGKGKGD